MSVRGAVSVRGAGNDRAAECSFGTVGSGGKESFSVLVRRLMVGKEGDGCWACVDSRIFIISLAFMICTPRVSCTTGFAGMGGVKGAGFTGGDGVGADCNGDAGGCD